MRNILTVAATVFAVLSSAGCGSTGGRGYVAASGTYTYQERRVVGFGSECGVRAPDETKRCQLETTRKDGRIIEQKYIWVEQK